MNDSTGPRPERRHHARIAPKGAVILHVQSQTQQGRIGNVGEGGMFMLTSVSAPDRWLGREALIDIRLDGGRAEWLHAPGRIIRIRGDGLALAFDAPPPNTVLRMIDEITSASRASKRVLSVVLIDADAARRFAMAAGFRSTGCRVVEASTPLEAIVRLGESSFEPDVVAVADSHPTSAADEMRAFVERAHPHAKLVTIGDDALAPDGILHWLSSSDPDADLTRRVRDVLVRPRR